MFVTLKQIVWGGGEGESLANIQDAIKTWQIKEIISDNNFLNIFWLT